MKNSSPAAAAVGGLTLCFFHRCPWGHGGLGEVVGLSFFMRIQPYSVTWTLFRDLNRQVYDLEKTEEMQHMRGRKD